MKKNNSFKIQNLNLIKVNYSDSHIRALFKILKERKINFSISHKNLPTYKEHKSLFYLFHIDTVGFLLEE